MPVSHLENKSDSLQRERGEVSGQQILFRKTISTSLKTKVMQNKITFFLLISFGRQRREEGRGAEGRGQRGGEGKETQRKPTCGMDQ